MNKTGIFIFVTIIATLSLTNAYASNDKNVTDNNVRFHKLETIDENSKIFQNLSQGKNKPTIKFNNHYNNLEFMIKGVISASSSGSITVNNKIIIIDSSVIKEVKIVGAINVGSYAMIKGITQDSNLYAEKIIIDQRNIKKTEENGKKENNEQDEVTITPTVSPTISPTLTIIPTPIGTESANTDISQQTATTSKLGDIIIVLQNFLNYLKNLASKI